MLIVRVIGGRLLITLLVGRVSTRAFVAIRDARSDTQKSNNSAWPNYDSLTGYVNYEVAYRQYVAVGAVNRCQNRRVGMLKQ